MAHFYASPCAKKKCRINRQVSTDCAFAPLGFSARYAPNNSRYHSNEYNHFLTTKKTNTKIRIAKTIATIYFCTSLFCQKLLCSTGSYSITYYPTFLPHFSQKTASDFCSAPQYRQNLFSSGVATGSGGGGTGNVDGAGTGVVGGVGIWLRYCLT